MRAAPATANRTAAVITRLYTFGAEHLDLTAKNPAAGPQSSFEEHSRERVLADHEMRLLWLALDDPMTLEGPSLSPPMALCIQLCALTLRRANEVAGIM